MLPRWLPRHALLGALLAVCACGDDAVDRPTIFGGDRPTELRVPASYDGETAPLLLVLHGYSINGAAELGYSRLDNLIRTEGALVLAPDGTEDADGNRFWNVEHPDCNIGVGGARPDDVGYLLGLIDEVAGEYSVDPGRVFIFGHSNGGFMAHRLACEHADRFAAIVSLAGVPAQDTSDCAPSQPVGVLQIHGDADDTVSYAGGSEIIGFTCDYPGAIDSVARWAEHNGCTGDRTDTGDRVDLDTAITGDETVIERYQSCPAAGVELWTIPGGGHIPPLPNGVYQPLWQFLAANAR